MIRSRALGWGMERSFSQEADELSDVFESVARYFSLLSEPNRLRILNLICRDERTVQQIVEGSGISQSNVSRHLALLYRAGVLGRRKDGNLVWYRVSDQTLIDLCRSACVRMAGMAEESAQASRDFLELMKDAKV